MFESHLEGIGFSLNAGVQVNMSMEEFGRAVIADPTGNVIAADFITVVAFHGFIRERGGKIGMKRFIRTTGSFWFLRYSYLD